MKPVAWMNPKDGTVISDAKKYRQVQDGYMQASMHNFSVPLYPKAATTEPENEPAVSLASVQPSVQEPVAHITGVNAGYFIAAPINRSAVLSAGMALYAHPQAAGVNLANVSACPWCGQRGPDYDESEKPSDYCHHDPATTTGSPHA